MGATTAKSSEETRKFITIRISEENGIYLLFTEEERGERRRENAAQLITERFIDAANTCVSLCMCVGPGELKERPTGKPQKFLPTTATTTTITHGNLRKERH
jgi:hypothetical protein